MGGGGGTSRDNGDMWRPHRKSQGPYSELHTGNF